MKPPLHVIQTVASLAEAAGGPPRTVVALSEALARQGATVDVVAGNEAPLMPDAALVVPRLVRGPRQFGRAIAAARSAGRGPAILHDNGIWSAANRAVMAAARRERLPYAISPHGMLEPWALDYHRYRKWLAMAVYQRRALTGAAVLFATAEPERAAICKLFPRVPIATIANGVAIPAAMSRDRSDTGPATLLFLSRLHPKKNLLGLLDAWAVIAADPRFGRWTLRIAGPDENGHAAVVVARVAALGLDSRVILDGPVAEAHKAQAFAGADLFVLPSFSENFGIVVTEALAHGVPAIATTGAPWAALSERGCGWSVAPEPGALAAALTEAMLLPASERAAMGARGRAWVAAAFGWDGIAARTLVVYEWVLHGGRRPDCVDG